MKSIKQSLTTLFGFCGVRQEPGEQNLYARSRTPMEIKFVRHGWHLIVGGPPSRSTEELTLLAQIKDYFWHLTLPLIAMIVSGFAGLTFLTKNSFIDQINQQYVMTARAKGLSERKVLYNHVPTNVIISGNLFVIPKERLIERFRPFLFKWLLNSLNQIG